MMAGVWAVDFDGTLAEYDGWQGPSHVGAPIERTVRRVKHWLKDGKDVRIFTARVYVGPEPMTVGDMTLEWVEWAKRNDEAKLSRVAIQNWCLEHIGQVLPVTCQKDYSMVLLLDDRALQCYPNTGELVQERLKKAECVLAHYGYEYEDGQYVNKRDQLERELEKAELVAKAEMDVARTRIDEIGQNEA
jgi:hypothetical protein